MLEDLAARKSAPSTPLGGNQVTVSPRSTGSSWQDLEKGKIALGDYLRDTSSTGGSTLPPSQEVEGKLPEEAEQRELAMVEEEIEMVDLAEEQDNDSVMFGES